MESQEWDEEKFCNEYENTWEISRDEVHFGWLTAGENELELLKKIDISTAKILDVGCGMAQNLVALSRKGAQGYGLDISTPMLTKAHEIVEQEGFAGKIILQQGDMRDFTEFSDIEFDVILSIYSMEYLTGVIELRKVIHNLFKRLKHGGIFIMCFSHPSQVRRHPDFVNQSVPQGSGKYRILNYSFKDATEALIKAGFCIDRIIEQQTKNPSKINYQDAKKHPYHFKEGRSPFVRDYDEISNNAPHTIIYVASKIYDPTYGLPKKSTLSMGYRELWGYKRKIIKFATINYLGLGLNCLHLAKRDNILGLVDLLNFKVEESDLALPDDYVILDLHGQTNVESISVPKSSILGIIHRRLAKIGIKPIYKVYSVDSLEAEKKERRVFIESILGLDSLVSEEFISRKIGLLTFVNGREPSMGELPLDIVHPILGDLINLIYVAYTDNSKQGLLF